MCGICGEIRFDHGSPDMTAQQAMAEAMRSRGPNGGGVFGQGRVALGHRRLSILDLAPTSQQPMIDADLGLAISFNGCIYNFRELRDTLVHKGYRFFSDGDTEVILKAFHAWGPRCVERFLGMFAFAIWERDSGRVVFARDRLGIKPLYLATVGRALRFASTLPALLAAGDIDTSIDHAALHHYMSLHAVVPPPRTILNGVRKLPPATLLIVEADGRERQETYWTLPAGPALEDRRRSLSDWSDEVLAALRTAVDRRRVADVPVGVLLSGGLDSSLVVALLAARGEQPVETFAIGFDGVDGIAGDEFRYSDLIAQRFATEHQRIRIDSSDLLSALPDSIAAMSEPMASHDTVGFYLLARDVSRHVRAVQSGQGADEIFGGYHWHGALARSNDMASDYARLYFDRDHAEMGEVLAPPYMNGDVSRAFVDDFLGRDGGAPIDRMLRLETEIMLVDDPVKRVDNMTMAWGLEARVPFLDHELVELAARIPADLKIRDGGKYILKETARAVLPAAVIDRPKGYFPVPALKYLRGPYRAFVRDVLEQPAARQRGLFRRDYVERLLADPEAHLTPKGHSKLWQIAVLECWLQTHGI